MGTLLKRFHIERVNRILKFIGRVDKKDCAIDLRCQTSIFFWRQFCLTSKWWNYFFLNFFRQSVYFHLKRRENEKKNLTKKFPFEFSEKYLEIFFKSESIPIMSFQNFSCWSRKFSHAEQKWTLYTLNWRRKPPCQFYP